MPIFRKRELAGLEWNKLPIEKGEGGPWSNMFWYWTTAHCQGMTKVPNPTPKQKGLESKKKKKRKEER